MKRIICVFIVIAVLLCGCSKAKVYQSPDDISEVKIFDGDVYATVFAVEPDYFIALSTAHQQMYIKVNSDAKMNDIVIGDTVAFSPRLNILKTPFSYKGDGMDVSVEYLTDEQSITYRQFDPDNIRCTEMVQQVTDEYLIVKWSPSRENERILHVYCDNISEICESDTVIIHGKGTRVEKDGEEYYEVRGTVRVEDIFAIDEKPVIYLYPEKTTEVSVSLELNGKLTCTYPEYDNGWTVTASPDGTLKDKDGREYYCLYWEGETYVSLVPDKNVGFVIEGKDTAEFLREKLLYLGLNEREANEFIIYWLPKMQSNAYNYIYFAQDEYAESAKLEISPSADTVIRVMMVWQPLDKPYNVTEQKLTKSPERNGFTVVEWGGQKLG